MDPLSLTASIIAIIGVGGQVAKTIRNYAALDNASDLTLALNNEIADLQLIVLAIQDIFERQRNGGVLSQENQAADTNMNTTITNSLLRANEKVLELELLHKRITTSALGSSESNALKKVAWLREQNRVRQIQKDLRSVRLKLAAALGFLNLSTSLCLETGVQSLQTDLGNVYTSQQEVGAAQEQRAIRQEALILEPVNQLLAAQQRMEARLGLIEATNVATARQSEATAVTQSLSNIGESYDHGIFRNTIQASTSPLHLQCNNTCTCICHDRQKRRTPPILNRFLGMLFVGYVGLPYLTSPCNSPKCYHTSSPTVSITYFFPSWLITRAFRLVLGLSTLKGPELHLRVARIVPNNSRVFALAASGDIEGMKELFRRGLASPFDVDDLNKHSPLMYAISYMKVEQCCFLLQAGSDPYQEDIHSGTPHDVAWHWIINNTDDTANMESLKALFPSDNCVENWNLSLLHKAVLRLCPINLDLLLNSVSRLAVDEVDIGGRTALFWAAKRGDSFAVSLLLKHGADPNKKNFNGSFPLYAAISSKSHESVRLILEAGCDINYKDRQAFIHLHYCCFYGVEVDIVEKLVSLGADIEARVVSNETPLMIAVQEGHFQITEYLISQNAKLDNINMDGESALHISLLRNQIKIVGLLLEHKADHRLKTNLDETVLHYAAQYAGLECLEALYAVDLEGVDIDDRAKGLTALQMTEQRVDTTPEWTAVFQRLLQGIERRKLEAQAGRIPIEMDAFEDAMEYLG